MSDKESWINSFTYMAPKVNPARACATYEQVEAQNRKNAVRYGGSSLGDKGVDIATAKYFERLKEEYMRTD